MTQLICYKLLQRGSLISRFYWATTMCRHSSGCLEYSSEQNTKMSALWSWHFNYRGEGEMVVDIQYAQILKLIKLSHSLMCTQIYTPLRFYCYYPYLTNEKTEAQREWILWPTSHRLSMTRPGFYPGASALESVLLYWIKLSFSDEPPLCQVFSDTEFWSSLFSALTWETSVLPNSTLRMGHNPAVSINKGK